MTLVSILSIQTNQILINYSGYNNIIVLVSTLPNPNQNHLDIIGLVSTYILNHSIIRRYYLLS